MWGGRPLFPMLRNQGIPSTPETGSGLLVVICTAVERWEQKETSTPCGTWNAETHSDYRDGLTAQLSRRGRCAADARSAAVGGCAAWQADVVGVQLQISHGWDVRPHPPGLCLEANHTRLGYQAGKIDRIHKRRVRSLEGISVTPRATEDQAIKFLADESYPTEELKAKVTTKVCAFTVGRGWLRTAQVAPRDPCKQCAPSMRRYRKGG